MTSHARAEYPQSAINEVRLNILSIAEALNAVLDEGYKDNDDNILRGSIVCRSLVRQSDRIVSPDIVQLARRLKILRRQRDKFFESTELFGEPAWEILLDLFYETCLGRDISVSSACIASAAPASTALRYIERMVQQGLLERTPCTKDQRVVFVRLTDAAFEQMREYLSSALQGMGADMREQSAAMRM